MPHPSQGYILPDNTRVPGTTTIIGRYKESGGLIWWACEQGQKSPDLPVREALYGVKDKATDIGTGVHLMVEARNKGEDPLKVVTDLLAEGKITAEGMKKIQSGFEAYLAWERMTKLKIIHQEIQLVCPKYRFGGTPDAIGIIDGKPCLLDWKTSKAVYPDMLVQLAAYGHLVKNGLLQQRDYEPLDIDVSGFHLCKFSKEHGDFSHHYFPDLPEGWEQFKRFRECYDTDKILKARAA
jgi:hypothetical protein